MKKMISAVLCAMLMLTLLAACQNTPEVPYVTGGDAQGNQQVAPSTQPSQGGQQTTPSTQPNQDGQQTTPSTQPNQGGQQTPPSTQPSQGGQQTTPPSTQPNQGGQQGGQTQTDPTEPEDFVLPTPEDCTYEQYMAMTGEQQEQFFNQFQGDFEAFFAWMDKAKAESDANSGDIVVDPDTTIDLNDIFGNQ